MYSVEKNIQQAVDRGDFDNLDGKGKPIKLAQYPYEDPDLRLSYHIIHNGGFSLTWIENRKSLLKEIHLARQILLHAWERCSPDTETDSPTAVFETSWQAATTMFTAQVESINTKINRNNLETPLISLQLSPLSVKHELELTTRAASDTLPLIESPI